MSQKEKLLKRFFDNPISLGYSEIQIALFSFGFKLTSIRGSHHKYHHPKLKRPLIIPVHHGDCKNTYKSYTLKLITSNNIHTNSSL